MSDSTGSPESGVEVLWQPGEAERTASALARFHADVSARRGIGPSYDDLHRWSVEHLDEFWGDLWRWYDVDRACDVPGGVAWDGSLGEGVLVDGGMPLGVRWFPGVRMNLAAYLLAQGADDAPAVIGTTEAGDRRVLTWGGLRAQAEGFAAHLRSVGVGPGDRVVGYLPNVVETVAAFLGTALVGATWSSVGQDYAPSAVLDRFGQLEPVVLVAADGHRWSGRTVERLGEVAAVRDGLPSVRHVVVVPVLGATADVPGWATPWEAATAAPADPHDARAEAVPFDHPLWVLYSSGTTGKPKGLVHGHGGVLLELLKVHGLHHDVREGDVFFWYTSPSWVMWNISMMAMALGAAFVAHDGSPVHPSPRRLWEVVADERATFFGTSPGFLQATEKAGIVPREEVDLSALRGTGSTGSPLSAHSHRWAREAVGDVPLWSISGGTDVTSAFLGGAPTVPISPGELPVPLLGAAVASWDPQGRHATGRVGELVVTRPMPSMPVHLWADPDGERYRAAYFDTFDGVWRHGDWITVTDRGSVTVHGRSDATLNRNGIRMGSADLYAALEQVPEVADSLVVGVDRPDGSYWMPLFVVLAEGAELDDALRDRLRAAIREHASPRHVPDEVVAVRGLPRTRTGKKLEVPVKRILLGASPDEAANRSSVDDPTLLDDFVALRDARG